MATFENVGLALQLVDNAHNLVRNMRDNANGYKRAVLGGVHTLEQIKEVMLKDAGQYLFRLQWMTDVVARNSAGVSAALGALNLTMAEAGSLKNTLVAVAEHTTAATLNSANQINAESDYILANVPNFERIF